MGMNSNTDKDLLIDYVFWYLCLSYWDSHIEFAKKNNDIQPP